MKIRTQLILSFLLLSVLPLAGIVVYSYQSSTAAFQTAVEAEARELTDDIASRMGSMRGALRRRVNSLRSLPIAELATSELGPGERLALLREIEAQLGDQAEILAGVEWLPDESRASDGDRLFIELEAPEAPLPPGVPAEGEEAPQAILEHESRRVDERINRVAGRLAEVHRIKAQVSSGELDLDSHSAIDHALETEVLTEQLSELAAERAQILHLLGESFESRVMENGMPVGRVRAAVRPEAFLREVLQKTRMKVGDVPFAVDPDGRILTPDPALAPELSDLSEFFEACQVSGDDRQVSVVGDWLIATRKDPESDLLFGVARPVGAPLAAIQSAAIKNFFVGMGGIGLALLGMLPLSGRLSRRLNVLTASAERLGGGDLDARADGIKGRDEVATLALTFNRMADELQANQDQIVEQQLQQRLLEKDNQRKSAELEAARQFQLSLLPDRLPTIAGLDVAFFMRTAAEVGGDYYDFRQSDKADELLVVVGDATGHGAMAGTMVTAVKSLFAARSAPAGRGRSLAEFLARASRTIHSMGLRRMSMSLVMVHIKAPAPDGSRPVVIASAGMPPVVIHRGTADDLEEIVLPGMPLGAMRDSVYQQRELTVAPGDCLLVMSDGFPELRSPDGEVYGYQKIYDLLRGTHASSPQATIEELAAEVERFSAEDSPSDDVTFAVIKVREP